MPSFDPPRLRGFFEENPRIRYIMYGGKGGLGKTTFSAATAFYLAKKGYKVLVFSVDPQASLSDIFVRGIFGEGEVEIMPNLYACEVDADRRIKTFGSEIRKKILDMYGFESIPEEIDDYIKAASCEPAMEESAIFDEVIDLITKGGYDYYIYDLVPLGHALYYLSMSSVYDTWINKISDLRYKMQRYDRVISTFKREKEIPEDKILKELLYIKERINTSSKILNDPESTAFFFVLTPEKMSLIDTLKAATLFSKFNVPIRGFIINRVIPKGLLEEDIPGYLRERIKMQEEVILEIKRELGERILGLIPEFDRDIRGLEMIERMSLKMFS